MDRSASLSSAAAAASIPTRTAPQIRLTQGPPASSGETSATKRAADSAEVTERLTEDHDRIAQGLHNIVVRRLFAAGLDLQSALGLMGKHRANPKIHHALHELDQAIRDLRDTIFDRNPPDDAATGAVNTRSR